MELNFGTYWVVRLKEVHTQKFGFAGGSWYLLECHLKAEKRIDTLEVNRMPAGGVQVIINGKSKQILNNKMRLNAKLPIEIKVNEISNYLDGNDKCIIGINKGLTVTLIDNIDDLVVKKVIPDPSGSQGDLVSNLCYSYNDGVSYCIPIKAPLSNNDGKRNFKMRFSSNDLLDTLKGAALKTEGFTKNEIAGEIEALLNPSS